MNNQEGPFDEFYSLPTGNICDGSMKLGYQTKVMDSGIRPIAPKSKIVGFAFTVRCPARNNLIVHEALAKAPEGSVLVIDAQGYMSTGHIGDIVCHACIQRGIRGIILDGTCRDIEEINELKFPVFSRGANPYGNLKYNEGSLNESVRCGGITVVPGDIVVADMSGVVVLPKEEASAVLKKAKEIFHNEIEIVKKIKQGKTTMEIFGFKSFIH